MADSKIVNGLTNGIDSLSVKGVQSKENGKKLNIDNTNESKENIIETETDGKPEGSVRSYGNQLPKDYAHMPAHLHAIRYNMDHARRGHCLVFNHSIFDLATGLNARNGTDKDRDSVHSLFKMLGFDVHVFNNLTVKDVMKQLEHYAYEVDHSDVDCLCVIFMSHGEDGHFYGFDRTFKSEKLFAGFTADHCPSLAGKPKMFFIQACRGESLDKGVNLVKVNQKDETDHGSVSSYKIPTHADFLTCWSTVPGHFSWRNTTNGSWFIQSLSRTFSLEAVHLDVLSMMTNVNRYMVANFESNCPSNYVMHGKKQTCSVISTLMRQIWLTKK